MRIKAFVITLIICLSLIPYPTSHSQSSEVQRGEDYIITQKDNTYTFETAPKWILDNGDYQPYVYENNTSYYVLKNGRVALEVYPFYARYYSLDMSVVRLYDERFEIEEWRPQGQGRWADVGAQVGTPIFILNQTPTTLNLTKSFTSISGQLNITYTLREGQPLKHTIIWRSYEAQLTVFRLKQLHAGITGDKVEFWNVVTKEAGKTTITQPNTINATVLRFLDANDKLVLGQDLDNILNYTLPTELDLQANGIKADYYYRNETLSSNELMIIDPTTYTSGPPVIDTNLCYMTTTSIYQKENLTYLQPYRYSSSRCDVAPPNEPTRKRGAIQWDISGIPDTAVISDVYFKYHGQANLPGNPRSIYRLTATIPDNSAQTLYNLIGNNYQTANATFPEVKQNATIGLGSNATSDVTAALGSDIFGIILISGEIVDNQGGTIWETSYVNPQPVPTLKVVYTLPSIVFLLGIWYNGIESLNGNSTVILVNDTVRAWNNNTNAIISPNLESSYQFWRYQLENGSHIHFETYTQTMTSNYTISAYALLAGGAGVAGVSMLIFVVTLIFTAMIAIVLVKKS